MQIISGKRITSELLFIALLPQSYCLLPYGNLYLVEKITQSCDFIFLFFCI